MRSEDASGTVLVERRGPVAVVTLNRPERLNAIIPEVFADLERALRQIGADRDCRAVVLTGAGRSFCTGMDLRATFGEDGDPIQSAYAGMRAGVAVILAMREIPQPVIAAVRGHAVGAGFAFAAASDMRICAPDAQFNAVFTKIGMSPGDLGLAWLLPRLIGHGRAAEVFYRAGILGADQALGLGLVSSVDGDPLAAAIRVAEEMGRKPRLGIAMAKELLNASLGWGGFREFLELEMRSQVIGLMTQEHKAAIAGF